MGFIFCGEDEDGTLLAWDLEHDDCASACQALREAGLESAEVWVGDPTAGCDKTGQILWACPQLHHLQACLKEK